ncbi:multicopper oxidase domain-containing protein [Clostridium sp. CF011]|uniref:multicopper oxidase domain-containing protein n=1 Tax=Clostridium sp. CF011 TaxID=2843318 RepID=UPI001C0E5CCF|nr:multicopper oxidase domain-containing protein [Clostridium sp. CF011]MBU3093290.1 multicopper oxidase domain-containing protein [Clostridium sp. CF011]WAG70632.1 multicopper oxidase domain-containing protein [Clostridium sp. CF011]
MSVRHYVLVATDGFIELPTSPDLPPVGTERRKVYVFGFVGGLLSVNGKVVNEDLDWTKPSNWPKFKDLIGTATIPSPMIWGEMGDRVYITLINLGMPTAGIMDNHTVHMHGAHVATQLDGFPESSFGVPMWMDFDKAPSVATYLFDTEHPGTYMYHCHVEASEHVQMGMYGALVVYPSMKSLKLVGISKLCNGGWVYKGKLQHHISKTATNRNFAYNDIRSYFDKEYIMLLSDIDTRWHDSVQTGGNFNPVDFKPDFWLVNGRAFPDTLLPHPLTPSPGSNKDVSQINYESYVHVKTGEMFLLRMINMGYQVVPWHIHGWHFAVIGKDANPSPFLKMSETLVLQGHEGLERGFTATIGSGETFDLLIEAEDKRPQYRNYIVNGQDCIPSLCKQMHEIKNIDPNAIANIPTEPVNINNINTVNYVDICDEPSAVNDNFFPQFYPMHNHDDYKVTNNGVYPGGQLTYIQTDAPESKREKKHNHVTCPEDGCDPWCEKEN